MFNLKSTYKNGKDFLSLELPGYFIDYIPIDGAKSIVFTFENADKPNIPRPDALREPWGGMWLHERGYAVIGVKPKSVEWYRGKDLHDFFRSNDLQNFLVQFDEVFLYGSSMGGFAAMAFADAIPGSKVIAFNPQSTLDPLIVPWETRYEEGRIQDWSGDFSDARIGATKAKSVFVAYDPLFEPDRKHINRLEEKNLIPFKMPLVGHVIANYMSEVGILSDFVEGALSGELSVSDCNRLARNRKKTPRYYYCLFNRAKSISVKEACLANILRIKNIQPEYQKDFFELLDSIGSWHLIKDPEFQKNLIKIKDEILFKILKKAADNSYLDDALKVAKLAIAHRKVTSEMLIFISESLWRFNRLQEAEAYARLALRGAPSYGNAYRMLARILFSDKRANEALDIAKAGVVVDEKSFLGWYDLARYYEVSGDFRYSLIAAEQAERIQPNNSAVKDFITKIMEAQRVHSGISVDGKTS